MRVNDHIQCTQLPCADVNTDRYLVPDVVVQPEKVRIVLISEAAPPNLRDNYYAGENALFAQTTLQAFSDAGARFKSTQELLDFGIYMTTAIKCGKTGYAIERTSIEQCSHLLGSELALFPNVQVYLLMGDVAIKAFNALAADAGVPRVIPAGPTYKIRSSEFYHMGKRVFPSYLQAGPSFFIEKSKRRMIAEDLRQALALIH